MDSLTNDEIDDLLLKTERERERERDLRQFNSFLQFLPLITVLIYPLEKYTFEIETPGKKGSTGFLGPYPTDKIKKWDSP